MAYNALSKELEERIARDRSEHWLNPYRASDERALRRNPARDKATLWRPSYVRDAEKILHAPYYNRLTDKTQVFSLYKNDDLARRSLHVQLVSRTARSIGAVLGLHADLIEAIALGHDIGHTPFGHLGERFLSDLLFEHTGRYFDHNVHSVRVLDGIFRHNLTLETLSGILCHNGEFEQQEYRPRALAGFDEFDELLARCQRHDVALNTLIPSTLEGCVVRICDMIAYVGKDRQDAERAAAKTQAPEYAVTTMGSNNAEIINNLSIDLIENSYGRNHLSFSDEAYAFLRSIKKENYELIYGNDAINPVPTELIGAMFEHLYTKLLNDLEAGNRDSYIFRHHLHHAEEMRKRYKDTVVDPAEDNNQIVVDYLASMSDDYFVELHALYFPGKATLEYQSYF